MPSESIDADPSKRIGTPRGAAFKLAENEAIGGRAYRLCSRPTEDPSKCASRISSRLEAAGIKTKVLAGFVPEEMGFAIQTGRKLHPSMIATPI